MNTEMVAGLLIYAEAIYYGDEIGLVGKNDPDCRQTMKWDYFNNTNKKSPTSKPHYSL